MYILFGGAILNFLCLACSVSIHIIPIAMFILRNTTPAVGISFQSHPTADRDIGIFQFRGMAAILYSHFRFYPTSVQLVPMASQASKIQVQPLEFRP